MFAGNIPWSGVILLFLPVCLSQAPSCLDPPLRQRHQRYIELACTDGKIFSIDVAAGRGTCGRITCSGFSPTLLHESLNCYWQSTCRIRFPTEIIVKTEDFINCLGKRPDFMRLESWRCLNISNQIIDMSSPIRLIPFQPGVIRSHGNYPWDYDYSDFSDGSFMLNGFRNNSHTFYLRPNTKLVLSTGKIGINSYDYLTYFTKDFPEGRSLSEGTLEFHAETERVTIQFLVSIRTNGGAGFVICFAYVRPADPIGNACDFITTLHGTSRDQPVSPLRMMRNAEFRRTRKQRKTNKGGY
ncbi:hypothetical protein CHS0354_026629 [Potamilus streckersoni]|uniref:CUB domain-containing protein n=1 Tax=Potamilus streckersoni TaxID=2493646 RepID=A0AAE0SYH7_9BIVA|nr:hypothetical protein CHS0354_026629 [Potamilus streckersoni]